MSQSSKKEILGQIINVVVALLTALATTLGLNSCIY